MIVEIEGWRMVGSGRMKPRRKGDGNGMDIAAVAVDEGDEVCAEDQERDIEVS